jgi:hypothetical protein
MKARQIVGMLLVAIGMVSLLWGGISWTHEETIVDFGPIEARARERETIPLPPILGGITLAAGAVLLLVPAARRLVR